MEVWDYNTQEAEKWHHVLRRFAQTDVYFLPEYHRAYELNGDGEAHAFVAEEGNNVLFYPFFIRRIKRVGSKPISEPWYDIETVYGYSGPLSTTTDPSFLTKAWAEFASWCRGKHIVAEFIRFNPFMENYRYVNDSCRTAFDRETVAVRLGRSEEELWKSYPSVQRNMVRKALRRGLTCEQVPIVEGLTAFRRLYNQTMKRVQARGYYYFSDRYFDYLRDALSEKVRAFVVRETDRIVAAALFFIHENRIHYHLAGSDETYRKFAPNNLLLHTVALWGQEQGFHWLHLGGGRTPSSDDSLFRFKASISRLRLPFYVGRRIQNQEVYDGLSAEWMRQKGLTKRPNYFILYRLEVD